MSVASIRLAQNHGSYSDQYQGPIFSKLRVSFPTNERQLGLWGSVVEFSPDFFESLSNHAVPLRKEAIAALAHSSRGLDCYVWLAYRLWRVNDPVFLRWRTLRSQFGRPEQLLQGFHRRFSQALKQALVVYPQANVEIRSDGVLLRKSAPPVPKAHARDGLLLGE
tara:strand:- start:87 stop:581 length:495 start_codon:yes stop_codon:yes gene_type:complete